MLLSTESISKHQFIVFCQDHYNPLTLIRSLGESRLFPIVILVSAQPYLASKSKYIGRLHKVASIEEGYELLLVHYGDSACSPFLYSASDDIESYLDLHYNELKDKFLFFNGGEQGRITSLMNKEKISLLAKRIGFRIPKAIVVGRGEIPRDIPFPVMTKAIISTHNNWKNDVFICNDEEELKEAYKSIQSDPVLVEEFIRKKNELCVDGISINGGEEVFMPFRACYIRMSEKAYGNYMTISPFTDDTLKSRIRDLIRATGFSGIFSIEFLVTQDDSLVFLEVNFRHSTWAYSSLVGGANLPVLWALGTIAKEIPLNDLCFKTDSFTAMAELSDFSEYVCSGKLSLWSWLKDFHKCECTYIYNRRDMRPVFSLLGNMAKHFIAKKLHFK